MAKIKVLIFDLDGTLLDTIEDIKISCNNSLIQHGLKPYDTKEYKIMVGDGVDKLIDRCLKNQNADRALFQSVKKEYLDFYRVHQFDNTIPYDGIVELLEYAKDHQIECHVLSNKPHSDTVKVISHIFGEHLFSSVTGKKEGYLPKPDPQMLLEILNKISVNNQDEILYIGDTLTDMLTAKNAGLNKVGVLWGFRDLEEIKSGNPEMIVNHPSEIISLLRKGSYDSDSR
ncbi:MAG: HAD family hydrolase [Firmicutes bacterium]|nr:HAD family hydrolase [Bacillota bacterium]